MAMKGRLRAFVPLRAPTAFGYGPLNSRESYMRVFLAAAMIMLSAATAVAQGHVPQAGEKDKDKRPAEIEAEKEVERAYKRSLDNIPNQSPADPWGVARSNDAPTTSSVAKTPKAKTPKAKTKTGTANN